MVYDFVCDADHVIHADRAVPHLSAIVIPESDGSRGWLGVGDPEATKGSAVTAEKVHESSPLPELPFRVTVEKAVDRDHAIVRIRSRDEVEVRREIRPNEEINIGSLQLCVFRIHPADVAARTIGWVEFLKIEDVPKPNDLSKP